MNDEVFVFGLLCFVVDFFMLAMKILEIEKFERAKKEKPQGK